MPMIAPKYDTRRASRKDRRPKLHPTVPAGTPMGEAAMPAPAGVDQVIPEATLQVGEQTGTVYSRHGDNPNGPELMQTIPPPGPVIAPRGNMIRSFATGGTQLVGGNSAVVRPLTPEEQARINAQQGATTTAAPAASDPLQAQLDARRQTQAAQQGAVGASAGVINANRGVIAARQASVPASQAVIDANGRVLDARSGTLDAQQGVNTANRGVVDAEGNYIAANRGVIQFAQTQNRRALQDEEGVQAARANVADLTATGQAQTAYNDQKYRFDVAGVTPDVEVELPNGTGQQLAPGVRGKIMSQADLKERQQRDNAAVRALQLENARLALQMVGTNVDEARNIAARAGLTLDEAQLLVDRAQIDAARAGLTLDQYQLKITQAQNAADVAGLGVDTANLGVRQAQLREEELGLPPRAGMQLYTDPVSGVSEWVSPAEADMRNTMYQNRGLLTKDPATGELVPAELGALSDSQLATGAGEGIIPREQAQAELVRRGYSPAAAEYLIQIGEGGGGGGFSEDDLNTTSTTSTASTQTTTAPATTTQQTSQVPNLYESSLRRLRASGEGIDVQR